MSTNMSPHLSLQVKLKLVRPCCTVTSDRHAEGQNPKYTNRKDATKKPHNPQRTSQVHKHYSSINPDAASYLQKEVTFRKRAAVFSIVIFCCG